MNRVETQTRAAPRTWRACTGSMPAAEAWWQPCGGRRLLRICRCRGAFTRGGAAQRASGVVRSDWMGRQRRDGIMVPDAGAAGRSGGRIGARVFFPDWLTQTAGHRFRFTGSVGPVTDGNRLNSNLNSNKFKSSRATGFDRFTGRLDRFTGRFDRFEFKFKFNSSRATGLPAGLTGGP